MVKLHPGDAWGGGNVCLTWAPAPMPDQVGDESLVWVDAHRLPKLIPSLVIATSEGWQLWGQKFISLWGLLQLLTRGGGGGMNSTYYPV